MFVSVFRNFSGKSGSINKALKYLFKVSYLMRKKYDKIWSQNESHTHLKTSRRPKKACI